MDLGYFGRLDYQSITTNPIGEGIDFILSHIQSPIYSGDIKPTYFDLWPKIISVDGVYMIRANSKEQMLYEFYKGDLKNCRIRDYPDYVDDYWTHAQDTMIIGGRGILVLGNTAINCNLPLQLGDTRNTIPQ